jgi:hypothetical protein
MSNYRRTAIRRLSVRRYRSIEELVLEDLPPLIVLYGPNGAGKSNILRAVQLVLRAAAAMPGRLPMESPGVLMAPAEADHVLDLRPDDFRFGDLPEIRVSLTVELGTRSIEHASVRGIDLEGVFQLADDGSVRIWFDRAELDTADRSADVWMASPARAALIRRLIQRSDAYRVPGGREDPQVELYQAFLSDDQRERDAAQRLGQRLARAGLFGIEAGSVGLLPVDSRKYGEKQIRFKHPAHGELPLRNLGSGEQQVVFMLGQRVITPYPIAHVEEPEAHLHKSLMEPLARVLRESVLGDGGTPDVDQLWMATHHHLFAIADEFFDVWLDERGATRVEKKPRPKAAGHFYEPGPLWDALRSLLAAGLDPKTVIFRRRDGSPATAGQIEASEAGDRVIFNEWASFASEQVVLSMKTKAEKAR